MGNANSTKNKYTHNPNNDLLWKAHIKKQLQANHYAYLQYEMYDEMTYKSGRTEIPKKKLIQLIKASLVSLRLNFFISVFPTAKPKHYYLMVSIVHLTKKEETKEDEDDLPQAIHIEPQCQTCSATMQLPPQPTMPMSMPNPNMPMSMPNPTMPMMNQSMYVPR